MREALTKALCLADGLSGYEKEVTRVMKSWLKAGVDDLFYDQLGSLIGLKKGTQALNVLLTGHVDEIGMVVRYYRSW